MENGHQTYVHCRWDRHVPPYRHSNHRLHELAPGQALHGHGMRHRNVVVFGEYRGNIRRSGIPIPSKIREKEDEG